MNISNSNMTASSSTDTNSGPEISLDSMLNRKPVGKQVIIIGSNIWLGAENTIFKGIITSTSSPVNTGLIANKAVPPYQMWAGSPARFIRNRD